MKKIYIYTALMIVISMFACKSENGKEKTTEPKKQTASQVTNIKPKSDFYIHLTDNNGMSVDLKSTKNEVFATLQQGNQEPVFLNGNYKSDTQFSLLGFADQDGKRDKYQGKITKNEIELTNTATGKTYKLSQNYSESVQFKAYSLKTEITDAEPLEDNLYLLIPENQPTLKDSILSLFFGEKPNAKNDKFLETAHNSFLKEAKDANQDDFGMPWTREAKCSVYLNEKQTVSLGINFFEFTGGAHGLGGQSFIVYDMKQNKTLVLEDIFSAEEINKISKIIYKKIKANRGFSDDEMADTFDLPIKANQNFYLSSNAIHFCYNPYEITAYANGSDEVTISYKELAKQNINPDYLKRFKN